MLVLLAVLACTGPTADTGDTVDTGDTADSGDDSGVAWACHEKPAPADRIRKIVVSHPYGADGRPSGTWEVLDLSESGEISATGQTFELGRSMFGQVVFTPDGELGVAVAEDGTLGAFRIEDHGAAPIQDSFGAGRFYATQVVMDPSGAFLWVLDGNWRENGGGIYRVGLGCDGGLTLDGLVAAGKQPLAMVLDRDDPTRAFVAARDLLDSAPGDNAHLLDLAAPTLLGGAPAFPDDEAIVSHAAWLDDGSYALVADNSAFGAIENRVAVVGVDGDDLRPVQVLSGIEDPVWLVPSPFDGTVLVVSGFGNGLYLVEADPVDEEAPFSVGGELAYAGGRPQLPGAAGRIDRGALTGLVLVAENLAVRRVRFEEGGGATDLGAWSTGSGYPAIVGAIGVQP